MIPLKTIKEEVSRQTGRYKHFVLPIYCIISFLLMPDQARRKNIGRFLEHTRNLDNNLFLYFIFAIKDRPSSQLCVQTNNSVCGNIIDYFSFESFFLGRGYHQLKSSSSIKPEYRNQKKEAQSNKIFDNLISLI